MLVLTRKPGQRLFIGADIIVSVNHVEGNQVQLGIEAPTTIPIMREELLAGPGPSSELPAHRPPWENEP